MPRSEYEKQTALITGASQGVGRALAHDLARRGADIVLVARSRERLDSVANDIRTHGDARVEVIAADLSVRGTAEGIARELDERGVSIDLLVNNAGMGAVGPFFDRPFEPNMQSVDLNITALMELTHLLGRRMVERGRGGIINIGSVAGFQPMPYQASYAASKAFVLSFTEALAEEVGARGVRVMASHPGPVATGFFDSTTARMHPRASDPARIAAETLDDFARGRSLSFPGRASDRATAFVSRILPRSAVAGIVGRFNRKNGYDRVDDVALRDGVRSHHAEEGSLSSKDGIHA